jgi:hypothetical protein
MHRMTRTWSALCRVSALEAISGGYPLPRTAEWDMMIELDSSDTMIRLHRFQHGPHGTYCVPYNLKLIFKGRLGSAVAWHDICATIYRTLGTSCHLLLANRNDFFFSSGTQTGRANYKGPGLT